MRCVCQGGGVRHGLMDSLACTMSLEWSLRWFSLCWSGACEGYKDWQCVESASAFGRDRHGMFNLQSSEVSVIANLCGNRGVMFTVSHVWEALAHMMHLGSVRLLWLHRDQVQGLGAIIILSILAALSHCKPVHALPMARAPSALDPGPAL